MFKKLKKWWQTLHSWEYRNPSDRVCSVCMRHEVEYFTPGRSKLFPALAWEVFHPGRKGHPCSNEVDSWQQPQK